jgi:hypothetical protein
MSKASWIGLGITLTIVFIVLSWDIHSNQSLHGIDTSTIQTCDSESKVGKIILEPTFAGAFNVYVCRNSDTPKYAWDKVKDGEEAATLLSPKNNSTLPTPQDPVIPFKCDSTNRGEILTLQNEQNGIVTEKFAVCGKDELGVYKWNIIPIPMPMLLPQLQQPGLKLEKQ